MISDHTEQIDIRKHPKEARPLPEVIHFEGERILTTWTDMHFGGRRQCFLCPVYDRRCAVIRKAVIHKNGSGPIWGCRVCMRGLYAIEHNSPQERRL